MRCWARPRWAISGCIFRIPIRSGKAPTASSFWRTPPDWCASADSRSCNVDSTVILEQPKLKDYRQPIRESLARTLGLEVEQVSVKFKTAEGVGPVGEGRSAEAQAIVTLAR